MKMKDIKKPVRVPTYDINITGITQPRLLSVCVCLVCLPHCDKKKLIVLLRLFPALCPLSPPAAFPESAQALGKLLVTIGSTLDQEKNKIYVKEIFRILERHANNKTINSRMRFMIRDLDELRVSLAS